MLNAKTGDKTRVSAAETVLEKVTRTIVNMSIKMNRNKLHLHLDALASTSIQSEANILISETSTFKNSKKRSRKILLLRV